MNLIKVNFTGCIMKPIKITLLDLLLSVTSLMVISIHISGTRGSMGDTLNPECSIIEGNMNRATDQETKVVKTSTVKKGRRKNSTPFEKHKVLFSKD